MSAVSMSGVLSLRVLSPGEVPEATNASASRPRKDESLAARLAGRRLGGPFKELREMTKEMARKGRKAFNISRHGHRQWQDAPLKYEESFSGEAELSRQHKLTLYRAYMWNMLAALNSSCVARQPKLRDRGEFLEAVKDLPKSGAAVFVLDHAFASGDWSVGRDLAGKDLDDPRILAMASEDWMGSSHPKLTMLPIGLDSKLTTGARGRAALTHFLHLMEKPKDFHARGHTLLSDAHLHVYTNPRSKSRHDRQRMIREIDRSVVDDWYIEQIPFTDHLDHVADAKFALCPEGDGLDTHRFYQNYALGTRCIVRDGPLSQLHAEFPGTVIVKNWRDVTAKNLAKWSNEAPPAHDGRLLTAEYWIAKVLRKASCGTELVPEL